MAFTTQSPEIIQIDRDLTQLLDLSSLYQGIVDIPFKNKLLTTNIDLGIIVLLLVDEKTKTLNRVALSNTELAKAAVKVSAKPFHEIKIPLNTKDNALIEAIESKENKLVSDWQYLFTPVLKPEEARLNQLGASIECSLIWPLENGHRGAIIFSFYQPAANINNEHMSFAKVYSNLASDKLSDLTA